MTRNDFNELVHQLSRRLYGFAFRILRNQEEAEDAVQEIFIKLWNMREKLNNYKSIEALSTTMIKNFCIDQLRKQKSFVSEQISNSNYYDLASPSPYEQMAETESNKIIYQIIENLPDIYKEVVKYRDIEGFSYEEIVEITGQNINTLRVNLSRARGYIREEYNKYQNEHRGIKQAARKVL